MKYKFLLLLLSAVLLLPLFGGFAVSAQTEEAQALYDGIVASRANSVQTWIDGALSQNAGITSEWYILALCQSGEYFDFSAYEQALLDNLSAHEIYSATTRQKYALCLIGVGSTDVYIRKTLDDSIGTMGIMSEIFGLHLLNNGYTCAKKSIASLTETLLSRQTADGGWALSGGVADVDVTAMAVQALAPQYAIDGRVKNAIDRALALLSARQLESGGYLAYGVENSESVAQVIIALSSLGMNCETDERFIKNGNTLLENLAGFVLSDGSLCHQMGGGSNENATSQALCAVVAYRRMMARKAPLYQLDARNPAQLDPYPIEPPIKAPTEESTSPVDDGTHWGYKPWVCIGILVLGALTVAVLFLLKKRQVQNLVAVTVAVALLIGFVCLTDFESTDAFYGSVPQKENVIGTVTVTVRCDAVVGKSDAAYLPADGVMLATKTLEIAEGDTVYTVLMDAARAYRLQVDCNGSGSTAYVVGIGYLYEFAFGDLSGWTYTVNGVSPSLGCGQYRLKSGDVIEWHYSLTVGENLE